MKTLLLLFVLPFAAILHAQPSTSVTYSSEFYYRTQCDVVRDPVTHAVTAAPWKAFFQQAGSDGSTRTTPGLPELSVDLVAHQADTVTVNGTPYPVGLALQIVATYIAQQRAAQWAAVSQPSP